MPKKLSVAIVGGGQIAGGYDLAKSDDGTYTHAGAFQRDGRFSLHTVCDLDPARAAAFRKEWRMEAATSRFEDVRNTFHDVVSLCTPDATHYELLCDLIRNNCCTTIVAEKPLALTLEQAREVERLAREHAVHVVVNFQRRFDPAHQAIRELLATGAAQPVAASACYIKGLEHIGVTMIDTLLMLLGAPRQVYAFNRVFNRQVEEYSYEFILFYDGFNVTVKTADCEGSLYNYHIFEIDLLCADRRITINDNSRQLVTRELTGYAYSGVKVLNDRSPQQSPTGYSTSMLGLADYVFRVTRGLTPHTVNTPESSCLNKLIVDSIISSYEKNSKLEIGAA